MQKITTLLFDIDGTILDTSEFILQATEHALSVVGYAPIDRSVIRKAVGTPFPDYYIKLTGSAEHAEKMIEAHRNFQKANFSLTKLFPGTLESLKVLKKKGYKIAAVTSRWKFSVEQTLLDMGISEFFDIIVSPQDVKNLKPHPEGLFKALEYFGEKPERAVMIGDSHLDIGAGKNAGTKTIRATYGFHADNLHNPEPDFFIDDIKDLLKLL